MLFLYCMPCVTIRIGSLIMLRSGFTANKGSSNSFIPRSDQFLTHLKPKFHARRNQSINFPKLIVCFCRSRTLILNWLIRFTCNQILQPNFCMFQAPRVLRKLSFILFCSLYKGFLFFTVRLNYNV